MNVPVDMGANYHRPIEIAERIYWVGFYDAQSGLHCNPYLIIDGEESVVIDGGSRPDFPSVMMKILSTGIAPSSISALIYQHYDPDLCGSVSNFEDIIDRADLKIISAKTNHMFIRHYAASSQMVSLDELGHRFRFASGRELRFLNTPYAHSEGSFVTFDEKTGVLFSSDLFGSYGREWKLILKLRPECESCEDYEACPLGNPYCPFPDIIRFHQRIMPSEKSLRFALEQMAKVPFRIIAPQHGSVINDPMAINVVCLRLSSITGVGIDGVVGDREKINVGRERVQEND